MVINWLLKNSDLILNSVGTLLVAFSFGKNIEEAYQTKKSRITKKEVQIYLASFLHPAWFKIGCALVIIGFILASLKR